VLVIKPDQEWETCTGDFRWTEGAFIVKRNGLYYLMYSAGFYAAPSYSMGYAVSDKPLGPYVKYRENPVMRTVKGFMSGPGHNSVFTTPDGASYCAFHIHTQEDDPGPNRQACIRPIDFHGDKIIFP
jgi:beta-xylosidase